MGETAKVSNEHRIEVSGWDPDGTFFVEKTELLRNEYGSERLRLRHTLPDGALIFVRPVLTGSAVNSSPTVYRIESAGPMSCAGLCEMGIEKLYQRSGASGSKTASYMQITFS